MVVMKALAAGFDRCVTSPKRVNQAGDSGGRMRIENRESILILIRYPPFSVPIQRQVSLTLYSQSVIKTPHEKGGTKLDARV
jgi:hypothetical protein